MVILFLVLEMSQPTTKKRKLEEAADSNEIEMKREEQEAAGEYQFKALLQKLRKPENRIKFQELLQELEQDEAQHKKIKSVKSYLSCCQQTLETIFTLDIFPEHLTTFGFLYWIVESLQNPTAQVLDI